MRPTRDPKYKNAWDQFDRWSQNKGQSQSNPHTAPHIRYSSKHCFYCKKGWAKGRQRTRQHLLPKRRGGLLTPENLRWCCYLCNQLLASVDDCPVLLNVYLAMISETPLRHLSARDAFSVFLAMRDDNCNKTVTIIIRNLVDKLKHKKYKYTARKILIYMKRTFPGVIRTELPKEEIAFVFPK